MFEAKNKKLQEEKDKKPSRPKNPIVEKQKEEAKIAPPKPVAAPKQPSTQSTSTVSMEISTSAALKMLS